MRETERRITLDEELIQRVENAARDGARQGARRSGRTGLLKSAIKVIVFVCIIAFAIEFVSAINPFSSIKNAFAREESVDNHDLTLENQGLLGYTVADFSEAVLGEASKEKKLEVYTREISDVVTVTDTGFANLKFLTKNQLITYHGVATYAVDLRKMGRNDFELDEENMTVTMFIPHAELNPINIPSEAIEFGDVEKGWLAFGEMKLKPEQLAEVETEAKKKMNEKLVKENVIEEADRYACLAVLETYQPIIKSVAKTYSLEVEFRETIE